MYNLLQQYLIKYTLYFAIIIQYSKVMMQIVAKIMILLGIIVRANSVLSITFSSEILTSYQTLATGVTYNINYTISGGSLTANSYTTLIFTNKYLITAGTLSNCQASTVQAVAPTNIACSVIYNAGSLSYEIKLDGMFPTSGTYNFLSLKFNINNPYAELTETIGTNIYNSGGSLVAIGSAFVSYTASVMSPCSISSSTQITGSDSTQTFSFTPIRRLMANSYLLIKMPTWSGTTSNKVSDFLTCSGISGSDSPSLICGIETVSTQQTINITNFVTSDRTALTPISISVATLKNPWSFQPFGPINFELMIGQVLTQVCRNNLHTVSQPNGFSTLSFTIATQNISTINTGVRLIFVDVNPFPKTGNNRVKIQFPSSVTMAYVGTSIVDSQTLTSITMANITSIAINTFTVTTPPSSRPYQVTISTFQVSSGTAYKIDQEQRTYQNSPGVLSSVSVTPANLFVNQITTYTIKFTLANRLISGSFMNIVYPSDIKMIVGTSTCTIAPSGHTCTIDSNNNFTITATGVINAGVQITATITSTQNAIQAKTTASFRIYTYYDSLFDSLVDSVTSGATVTMTAKTLVSGSATPASSITYDLTTYTIAVQLNDPIPAGGSILIIFPPNISPQSTLLLSASFATGSCAIAEPTPKNIQITNCFASQMSNLNVNIVLSNIRNPPSLKPSASFKIYFRGVSSIINYMQTGIIVTMTTPATVSTMSITPSSLIVAETSVYALAINQKINIHQSGDYIILELSSLMILPLSPTCVSVSGPTITCSRLSNTQLKIVYTSTPSSTTLSFNVNNVINYKIGDQSVIYKLKIFNSEDYQMEDYPSYPLTYQQSELTTVTTNNNDNIALGEASNITLTITNQFSLYASLDILKTKMEIFAPVGFTVAGDCISTQGTCAAIPASSKYQVTSAGFTLTNTNVTFRGIVLGYFSPASDSFKIKYTYDNFNVSVKQSGVTISPYCTQPCKRCNNLPTACQSCLPAPNTLIYYDPTLLSCQSSCVDGKYPDLTNQCTSCVSPCLHCLDSSNCTKCVTNTWLHVKSCLSVCPATFYNDTSGVCLTCQSPCSQCNSLTSCKTCATLYITIDQCVTAANCPVGTFANSTTMACESCSFPCLTCLQASSNCTTCQNTYLYYNNLCVQNCPSSMYPSGTFCFVCVTPCATCTSATFCSTCLTKYVYNGLCFEAIDCPVGTYPDGVDMRCKICPTGCTACETINKCTNCDTSIYFFYNFQCITSCPAGTYKSGVTCLPCQSPCSTCIAEASNCLSCLAPKLYFGNICQDSCPTGTYPDISVCRNCLSICQTCSGGTTCSSCTGSLYFQVNTCVSVCTAGFYGEQADNTCKTCQAPCSECLAMATNCTKCVSPLLQYQNSCVGECPVRYFQINGSCKTCPNCVNCLDATTCLECNPSYYEYNGVCFTSCPIEAPVKDQATNTCGSCDKQCLTCSGVAKNCTSCYSFTYLYKGTCLSQCPLGFIQDQSKGLCIQPLIGNVVYFPFCFTFLFCFIVISVSKCLYPQTQMITALSATISLCQFGAWALLTFILTVDYSLQAQIIAIGMYIGLAILCISIGVGITYNIVFYKQYQCDKGLWAWKNHDKSSLYAYRVSVVFSCISFRFFRIIYSRLFNRDYLSMYIADGGRFLSALTKLTIITLIFMTLTMMGISGFLLFKKQIYDQTFFSALDIIILSFIAMCLLTIDSFTKGEQFFEGIKNSLSYLKYRNMLNDQSFQQSLLSRDELNDGQYKKTRSQIGGAKEREQIFRKITFIDNNKFGHMNVLDEQDKDETRSLPEVNKLNSYPQYDPYNRSDGDRVIDDLFFLEKQRKKQDELDRLQREKQQQQLLEKQRLQKQRLERQRQRERLDQQRLKQLEIQKQQQRLRLKRLQEQEQQRLRKEQQQRRKRQLMEEDEQERVNLQFPDIIAIDRAEGKNNKDNRKNPLDLLSKSKKVDDRQVNDKALKKLQQIGKKNGIDPEFMKQTFGLQKNHNPELLNQIIDKHNHVKRQAVKQLFSENSNKQLLQQMFGKNSKMDPSKLRQIMNHPDSATLLNNLADKQNGRLSPQMAKQLLDADSKYNKQFTMQLLSNDNGMDHDKMKVLLKNANGKGKQSPLKALKKIGGQNLQNKQLLNNMLGQDAVLDPDNFTRVANDLSIKGIENLFKNKSKNSDLITSKILNNKKINLKNLAPIFQDQELLQELANALGDDNPNLEQNLMNLFKNADDIDPEKLKQMLSDPIIRNKLLCNPVDPDFLTALLSKNSNSDLKLLSKTLEEMPDQVIRQTFRFDPQKNVDFKNLATLFDSNPKTDPKLVSKMLEPDMVKELYFKGNDTKMLNKLVQQGNQFDPQVIKGVYGKQKNHFFETQTDNLMGFDQQKKEEFRSPKDYSLGFQKHHKSQVNMSRTAGGMMSFLTPIVPKTNKKNGHKQEQDDWSSEAGQQFSGDDDGQIKEEQFDGLERRKRKPRLKKVKKRASDIRLPAEQIYLQRIEAPHEHANRKASIRKKKKKVNQPGIMDEDNDIFDMDF